MHLMVVSLRISDTPVGYAPPRGPSMFFNVTYNQREAFQPTTFSFSNLGPKWTINWLSYIEDDPTNPAATAYPAVSGGGRDTFDGFDTATHTYQPEPYKRSVLVRVSSSPIRYERHLSDGTVEVFAQPDGASTLPRRVFLTETRDPQGNAATFTYDAQLRLVAVTDAIGQVTTLSHESPTDSRKLTRVTDPFGRFATFEYDGSGRLARITDVKLPLRWWRLRDHVDDAVRSQPVREGRERAGSLVGGNRSLGSQGACRVPGERSRSGYRSGGSRTGRRRPDQQLLELSQYVLLGSTCHGHGAASDAISEQGPLACESRV